ncbi:ABC transporter permease [Streptomonospora nanhaiensis]|uniref:ABC-2 type transport system permease protein n=1 Tax=Streptomonospora nanhaiensis TaxID=1323731 RepID=A0A853BQF0_9ACTN|nr:ABC transporter permease [Streptomonospora nanhaiensis]MBV2366786.1 ABC transporter permease [Streptomonospora nanhaiensis]MBX9387688.1 ABC transporter permease [Streptomonospora nanhaiensis]NYI96886.1 ABC-2 type transport system permease protein [Streptomonospora nanhaiensis]
MTGLPYAAPPVRVAPRVPPRPGLWTTYATLLRWTVFQIGMALPMVVVVQVLLAAGIIVGFGFLIPGADTAAAGFLATGAPTVLLMVVGLVLVPQGVAQSRAGGTFTYLRALPVPRPLLLLADLTVWLVVALPGIPVALAVAWLRYGLRYSFDWPLLVGAAVLAAVMAAVVGYAIAVLMPPLPAQLTSQVLVFFVMLFSPVTFPASRLPAWFAAVHDVLPFRPAADLLRAGMLADDYGAAWPDLAVLLAWCAVGCAVSVRALVRRG